MPPEAGSAWVEAEVVEVCRPDRPDHPLLRPHVVVLRERNGTRRLPMYTGSAEAIALACCLDAGETAGLRSYQLAANLLAAAGSGITEVRITGLADGVFYDVVVVEAPGGAVEVDARPRDAVNLAVLSGARSGSMPPSWMIQWSIAIPSGSSTRRVWPTWLPKSASAGQILRPASGNTKARPSPNPDGATDGEVALRGNGEPYTRIHSECGGNRVLLAPLGSQKHPPR